VYLLRYKFGLEKSCLIILFLLLDLAAAAADGILPIRRIQFGCEKVELCLK